MSKIVIVEDDNALTEMYRLKFVSRGFDIAVAHDGKEGLAVCEGFMPDLILLDLMMPEMTGEEMLQRLRQTDWGASIRVIVLTNISKDEAPANLRLLNVDRYIVKAHYTPSQVIEVVQEVLGQNPSKSAK
jgi:DNA-binding response OmpR family regulator